MRSREKCSIDLVFLKLSIGEDMNMIHTWTSCQIINCMVSFSSEYTRNAFYMAISVLQDFLIVGTPKTSQPRDVKSDIYEFTWILTAVQYKVCKMIVFQHDTCRLDSLNWMPQLIAPATKTNPKTSLTNGKLFVEHRKSKQLTWHHNLIFSFTINSQVIATISVILISGWQ